MNAKILETISQFSENKILEERKKILQPLIEYIRQNHRDRKSINLNFICTHNSRRSHLSQIWAQVMAYHFGIKDVNCYSGGTEATALFPQVAATLTEQGFHVTKLSENANPVYAVKYAQNEHPVIAFSKKYNDQFNPEADFCAIMTCLSADQGCPFIAGAEKRISVQYEDPKVFDGTDLMEEKYAVRSLEIAEEMWYIFKCIK